ncbi:hypothetical protein [Rudaeicoccus suwonensis]|uniref:hypothetical protein n=1 Tax=Rudaeicoccus suwonensis TaxID=657409 RepID=UPI0011A6AFF4|nr:hypothetical protein [Rudaeicoccus suwonensis]
MTPPSIRDFRSDDEFLDALGARRAPDVPDELSDLLQAWVKDIDGEQTVRQPGRYARARRGGFRFAATTAIVVGTLSISGVAAAVTGANVPVFGQVARNLGITSPQVLPSAVGSSSSVPSPMSTQVGDPGTSVVPTMPHAPDSSQRVLPGMPTATTGVSTAPTARRSSSAPSSTEPTGPTSSKWPSPSPSGGSSSSPSPTGSTSKPSPSAPTRTGPPRTTPTGGPWDPVSVSPSGSASAAN